MNNLEIEGRIVRMLDPQSGASARGPWVKQEFVLECPDGKFTKQVCFNVWGEEKVKELSSFHLGDDVQVSFSPSSREFNGKWYTDLRAWKISPVGAQQQQGTTTAASAGSGASSLSAAPAPTVEDMPAPSNEDFGDDLPF